MSSDTIKLGTRAFEYIAGASAKFWRITLDGTIHTVQYGRIGTQGQTQTKTFDDQATAARSFQNLIDEKLRKGYVEVGALASPVAAPAAIEAAPAPTPPPAVAERRAPEVAVAAPEPAAPELEWPPRRALRLDPDDWLWATWRPRTPRPRPQPRPFDKAAALKRIATMPKVGRVNDYVWQWKRLGIPLVMTRQEAHFWLVAMTNDPERTTSAELAERLGTLTFSGAVEHAAAVERLATIRDGRRLPPELILPLVHLFAWPELLAMLADYESATASLAENGVSSLMSGFRSYVLPFLSPDEIAIIHQVLLRVWPSLRWTVGKQMAPAAMLLAAATGLHEQVAATVAAIPSSSYTSSDHRFVEGYQRAHELVFGLGSAQEVEQQQRRLGLKLSEPEHLRAWLAHTEWNALEPIRDAVLNTFYLHDAIELLRVLLLVEAPEAAPHMLHLMLHTRRPSWDRRWPNHYPNWRFFKSHVETWPRDWLNRHPAHAIAGLLPVAARTGEQAEAAEDLLHRFMRRGYGKLIGSALDESERLRNLPAGAIPLFEPMDQASTPAWLAQALDGMSAGRRAIDWVQPDDLPPIVVGQQQLNDTQTGRALEALRSSTLEQPHPLVQALKQHADAQRLDRFAWRLFQIWLDESAPAKETWALRAVALWGNDASALKLAPLIREWPSEQAHRRAVVGLEVLRDIGSDTALIQIYNIADKVKHKGLQARAREAMDAIAAARGLDAEQLADRIVPDLGLDATGARSFSFGPRSFHVVLDPELKPLVRDEAGALTAELPRPSTKDDAAQARQALDEWKQLKKRLAEVLKSQTARLEAAMLADRRWSAEELGDVLLRHPVLAHLVQRLVWGVYDGNTLTAAFRVAEDRSLADGAERTLVLAPGARIGLVHAAQLDATERAAWTELLGDYQLVQPFAQLGRPVYRPAAGEQEATEITRFREITIPAQALVFGLDNLGWKRGTPDDNRIFRKHVRHFPAADITAVAEYQGVAMTDYNYWDDQKLERCFFVRGLVEPQYPANLESNLRLGAVDPVVFSEVLHDLSRITAKGSRE